MVDIEALKQAARIVKDENGEPVVQVSLPVWQEVVADAIPYLSQKQKVMALLKKWENEPENDMPEEWCEHFLKFLKANRMNFEERNLGFGDE